MIRNVLAGLLFLWFFLPLQAATIAFYNDYSINKAAVDEIIAGLRSEHDVIVADSIASFEALFSDTAKVKIDLAVLALQDQPHESSEFPNFTAFVEAGGKTIFADGNHRSSWETLFGFRYATAKNLSTVQITDPVLAERAGSDRIQLYNPGYVNFSLALEETNGSLGVFGTDGSAILYLGGHIMVNGFLLDTMQPYEPAPQLTKAPAAAPSAQGVSFYSAQVSYLLDPPPPALDGVEVPVGKGALAFLSFLLFAAAARAGRRR